MKALLELPASELLDLFASGNAAPAAGSAAALTAAMAAALVGMVAKLTVEKAESGSERLRARYGAYRARAAEIADEADRLRSELQALVQEDAEWVEGLVRFRRSEEPGPVSKILLRQGVELPLCTARTVLRISEYAEELFSHGYRSAAGDAHVAVILALAAGDAALAVADANLVDVRIEADWVEPARVECRELAARMLELRGRRAG